MKSPLKSICTLSKSFLLTGFALLLIQSSVSAQYVRKDLVSNQAGIAPNTEQRLVNAWGLVALPQSPFWVSDNGTGFSTLYSGTGHQIPLIVTVPSASGFNAAGSPTGIVGNIATDPNAFTVSDGTNSAPAIFLFATLDGTISGWTFSVDPTGKFAGPGGISAAATIAVPSTGAIYTGLAIGNNGSQTLLYAADGGPNRKIDVFNADFTPAHLSTIAFTDPDIPRNFTPYGIQNINGDIWVTYTALNKAQGGFVDHFRSDGTLVKHNAVLGPLHSPWGLAQAPGDFGQFSNAILVSNNISRGRINAFDPNTGAFLGALRDARGKAIEIDNVWALQFGQDGGANGAHNQLFFTAGPNKYGNGLFGVITTK